MDKLKNIRFFLIEESEGQQSITDGEVYENCDTAKKAALEFMSYYGHDLGEYNVLLVEVKAMLKSQFVLEPV